MTKKPISPEEALNDPRVRQLIASRTVDKGVNQLQASMAEKDAEIADLKAQLAQGSISSSAEELKKLNGELSKVKGDLQKTESARKQAEGATQRAEAQSRRAGESARQIEEEARHAKDAQRVAEAKVDLAQLAESVAQQKADQLQETVEEITKAKDAAEGRVAALQAENQQLRTGNIELDTDLKLLIGSLGDLQNRANANAILLQMADRFAHALDQLPHHIGEAVQPKNTKLIRRLRKDAAEATAKASTAEAELGQAKRQVEELELAKTELEKQLAELQAVAGELNQARKRIEELEGLPGKLERARARIEEIDGQLQEAQKQLVALQAVADELDQARARIDELDSELVTARQKAEKASRTHAALQEARGRVQQLEVNLDEAQQKAAAAEQRLKQNVNAVVIDRPPSQLDGDGEKRQIDKPSGKPSSAPASGISQSGALALAELLKSSDGNTITVKLSNGEQATGDTFDNFEIARNQASEYAGLIPGRLKPDRFDEGFYRLPNKRFAALVIAGTGEQSTVGMPLFGNDQKLVAICNLETGEATRIRDLN